ncbi:hypothetical protein LWF15_19960 [Kineosporia rhizophila]|uniref:hypothetical protein n=1 Tax=Kineosporia rhizophila TaxID=84633 RepID=UPI000AFD0B1A|nr:hypothetical protein [Kineosporia rhizophila]MCE0537772.1 hypothetical protein [Kineosporia rhizophila]
MVVVLKVADVPKTWRSEWKLLPGDRLTFGRPTPDSPVDIPVSNRHDVSRDLGIISTAGDHWTISNHTDRWVSVVSVDEGGAFARIPPGRLDAPVPFEISRLMWPCKGGEIVLFEAFSMDAGFRDQVTRNPSNTVAFNWSKESKHFLVLTALCEPQLRNEDCVEVPGIDALVARLQGSVRYSDATVSSVNAQIEYLAVKCGKDPNAGERVKFDGQKRLKIVKYAMRFGVVQWDDLRLLDA